MLSVSLHYEFTQRTQTYVRKHGLCPEYTITTVSVVSQVLPGHKRDSARFGYKYRSEKEEIQKECF